MYGKEIQQLLRDLAWVDDVTYYHSLRVGYLMSAFADTPSGKQMTKQAWVTRNEWVAAGLLHDIGKMRWPREILFSTEQLSDMDNEKLLEFWRCEIEHPLESERAILDFYQRTGNRFWERIAKGLAAHHENYSGGGYPYKLKGKAIPLLARGIRIFDRYMTMTEVKRYRVQVRDKESALKEIRGLLGYEFDPYWGEPIIEFLSQVQLPSNLDEWLTEELKNF